MKQLPFMAATAGMFLLSLFLFVRAPNAVAAMSDMLCALGYAGGFTFGLSRLRKAKRRERASPPG